LFKRQKIASHFPKIALEGAEFYYLGAGEFMKKSGLTLLLSACAVTAVLFYVPLAQAETLAGALAKAYQNNNVLNADRAGVRVFDENIAIARSAFRPMVSAYSSYTRSRNIGSTLYNTIGSVGIQLDQRIFDGFVTRNNVAAAQKQAEAQREYLRNSEQNQLFNAVQAYTDVYAARRIVDLRQANLTALEEQVRASRARLEVGEGTRTDLAQSEAQRSQALSMLYQARADVKSREALYQQIIGAAPDRLEAPPQLQKLPDHIDLGFQIAGAEHPAILAATYAAQAATYTVKAREGDLLPTLDFSAQTSYNHTYDGIAPNGRSESVGLRLNVPIYQGGRSSAQIRQSKEQLGQAQIEVDLYRDQVRAQLASAWSQLEGARASVTAYRESVRANQIALDGRIQENRVGQATTLDVLTSRTFLIDAQISLVMAERDVVAASYAVMQALGRMDAAGLGLQVVHYNPLSHYNAVQGKWIGTKIPDRH